MGDSNIVVISFHIRIILNIRNILVSHIYIRCDKSIVFIATYKIIRAKIGACYFRYYGKLNI